MRFLIVLCLLETLFLVHHTQSAPPKTEILALWNLGEVAKCVLDYCPLVYINYGCWCGFRGGQGAKPVDEIDSCCMNHHECYEAAVSNKTCYNLFWQLIDNYDFKCTNGTAVCSKRNHKCQSALCACDVTFIECLSHYPKPQERKKCVNKTEMSKGILEHFQH